MMSDRPRGCVVASVATSSALENDAVRTFLAERRRAQETSIVERLRQAASDGELAKETDPEVLGGAIAALLIGISMQARDGASKQKLRAMCTYSISAFFGDFR
jgi:chorismate mutase